MNPFANIGPQELFSFVLIFLILNITGLWPKIMRGISDMRGDTKPEPEAAAKNAPAKSNLEMCYRLLGISPSSTWDEVERAYRAKAKKHHPDHGGDEDAMRALNEAYSLLKQLRRNR